MFDRREILIIAVISLAVAFANKAVETKKDYEKNQRLKEANVTINRVIDMLQ